MSFRITACMLFTWDAAACEPVLEWVFEWGPQLR